MHSRISLTPTIITLFLGVVSPLVVISAHSPTGLLAWLFCLSVVLAAVPTRQPAN